MKEHKVNQLNNFIMGWYAHDTTFCDELIEYHNKPETIKTQGGIGGGKVDLSIKESTDSAYRPEMLRNFKYNNILNQCSSLYNLKYPYSVACGYEIKVGYLIQHYPIGGGFKKWHTERESADFPDVTRHLVWMTYLNDVDDGGTEFFHQGITIKAEKGLTLIWPADWTFVHRGQISNTKEKWIITGWYNLKNENENENRNLLRRPS